MTIFHPFLSDTDDEETHNIEMCVDNDKDSDGNDDVEESIASEDEPSPQHGNTTSS